MQNNKGILSLFTGAGGLDLGLEAAGFVTRLCVENDPVALETIALNRPDWKIAQPNDAIEFARNPMRGLKEAGIRRSEIVLLAGGPPCQPFSKASYWTTHGPKRMRDPRASSTIRAYLRIVRKLRPEALLFENVTGFAFKGRDEGFSSLVRGLRRINHEEGTNYVPQVIKLNAADYGVPQLRERIFVVAHRRGRLLKMPDPTHGPHSQTGKPYLTAWDAIGNLQQDETGLAPQGKWASLLPSIPEGQNYLWHTPGKGGVPLFGWRTKYWSFLLKLAKNLPAWTISASPGPAAGPFHWSNRLLTVKELCRLQTFPADFKVAGTRRDAQRQIGNAVPPAIAEIIGLEIRRQLLNHETVSQRTSLIPSRRKERPRPEKVRRVPREFLHLVGDHKPHPGTGKGPSPQQISSVGSSRRRPDASIAAAR